MAKGRRRSKPTPASGRPSSAKPPMGMEVSTPTGGSQPPSSGNIPHRPEKAFSSQLPAPVTYGGDSE